MNTELVLRSFSEDKRKAERAYLENCRVGIAHQKLSAGVPHISVGNAHPAGLTTPLGRIEKVDPLRLMHPPFDSSCSVPE